MTPFLTDDDLPIVPVQEITELLKNILSNAGKHYVRPDGEGCLGDAMITITSPSSDPDSYLFQRKVMVAEVLLMIMLQTIGESCVECDWRKTPDETGLIELRGHWVRDTKDMIERFMKHARNMLDAPYEEKLQFAQHLSAKVNTEITWGDTVGDEQRRAQAAARTIIADTDLERGDYVPDVNPKKIPTLG